MSYPKRFRSKYTGRTIKALKASILMWERRAQGEDIFPGARNCALCQRFDIDRMACEIDKTGERCPVFAKTGESNCSGSKDYIGYSKGYDYYQPHSPTLTDLAKKEVKFLKSLLPMSER